MSEDKASRSLWQRLVTLLEAVFDAMARYPCELWDLEWQARYLDPPESGDRVATPERPPRRPPGRRVRVVQPPASRRHRASASYRNTKTHARYRHSA